MDSSPRVVSLSHVLSQFPLSEEQVWSLAHQTFLCFKEHFHKNRSFLVQSPRELRLTSDGHVHPSTLTDDGQMEEERPVARSQQQLLSRFGLLLFRALDFGLDDDEERSLSRPLEALVEALTSSSEDEGFCDVTHDFDDLIEKCVERVTSREEAPEHYRMVCRAFVQESLELTMFLERVASTADKAKTEAETTESQLVLNDWLKNWIQVIKQLRNGVKLKHVTRDQTDARGTRHEYRLTPYEMLLTDIRLKNYKLNHVTPSQRANAPQDAHALILDFIRSRPPLAPASERQLGPAPARESSAFERLMKSIRDNDWKLKPTKQRPKWPSSDQLGRISDNARPQVVDRKQMTKSLLPQRRLIKANLNLHLIDDSDDSDDDAHDARRQQTTTKDDTHSSQGKSRRFSLRGLSLAISQRRHSMDAPPTPLDVNEDTRNHVAQIWEASEWGRTLQCLSLTLQEVKHFRSVLTKAEMESLAVTKELREDLNRARICFTCLKTRFSFFGARPNTCKVCERAICDRCASRMHIPCEHFDKVPIYMLSPTPSPPDPRAWPDLDQPRDKADTHRPQPSGPLVRVCRDCKRLVRHLIDTGSVQKKSALSYR